MAAAGIRCVALSRLVPRALFLGGLALALLDPGIAFAGHAMNEGNACMDCHDLKVGFGEPGTSFLGSGKRNLATIKFAWSLPGNNTNGKAVPDEFGCLYCHNSPVLKDDPDTPGILYENRMRDASNHFRGKASVHPVGYDLATGTPTDTSGQLLSTFDCYNGGIKRDPLCADDGSTADGIGDRAKELDCVDCHDVTQSTGYLGYPQHGKPLATNPLMLRKGVGVGFNLANGEYDDVCRRCHGSATGAGSTGMAAFKSTGKDLRLTAHPDASDTTTNVMKEYDGTLLKVADPNNDGVAEAGLKKQCPSCHASHYSTTNKKLFAVGLDVSDGGKCTSCHFPGDSNNLAEGGSFVKYGHGRAAIGFGCSSCHSVTASHGPAFPANGPKMFSFSPDTTPSKYGKDLTSICKTCHPPSKYTAHTGGSTNIGCLDCHDEHAEGVGSTSNRFMIPQRLPNNYPSTELSFFQSNGVNGVEPGVYDFFVADNNARKNADMPGAASASVCDNAVCHGGLAVNGTPVSPLSTFMTSGKHTGADQTAGTNCGQCHSHTDSAGSWAASNSCTSCHGQPPVSTATSASGYLFYGSNADESKTPHRRHVVDYGFGCRECHNQWTNAATHNTTASPTYESVWFDSARNPDAAVYPSTAGYTVATSTCNNLYCHSDGQRHQAGGSVGSPVWMTGAQTPDWSTQDLPCNSCHGATNGTVGSLTYGAPDHANGTGGNTANSHGKHPFACAVCHNATTQDLDPAGGWTLDLVGKKHVNGTIDLLNGGGYTFAPGAAGTHTCSGISCHGGNSATWGGASLSCDSCHFRTTANGGDRNNFVLGDGAPSLISADEWTTTGHGRATVYPGGNVAAGFVSTVASDLKGCLYCHDSAVAHGTGSNPFRLRNNNFLAQGNTAANAYGWNDVCLICHSTLPAAVGFDPDGAGTGYLPENSQAADKVNQNHYGAKHGSATQGGTFCWDCHDPHGDTDQYMFQGANGGGPGNGVTQVSDGTCGIPVTSRSMTGFDLTSGGGTPANFNSSDYVNASLTGICQTCHTTALYFNQTTNTALTSHNGADAARCTACHQHTKDFTAFCNSCHGYPPLTAADMGTRGATYPDALVDTAYGGYAGGGDAHNAPDHLATTVTAANGWTPCLPCHPNTSHIATTSVLRANINVAFPAAYNAKSGAASFTPGAGPTVATCANVSCHGGQATPVWSGGTVNVATQCTSCHIAEAAASQATATQWNSAWSGLHARAGSVSLENHTAADASVGDITDCNTCTQCHALPALHFSGLDSQATDPLTDADFVTTYDGTGGNISAATGCKVTCHSDSNGTTPRWARAWSSTVTATDGTECANCHGTWIDGWVAGVSHRTDAGPSNAHGQNLAYPRRGCSECHAIGSTSYIFSPKWNNGTTGNHGNRVIELNNSYAANPQRLTGADAGKTGCNCCHLANDGFAAGQHSFPTVTRWTFATLTNGQYSGCSGCHGTTNVNNYPDSGAQNGTAYENRAGAHKKHVDAIAARNAGTSSADASTCAWCHPGGAHSGDQSVPPADVMDGVANKFKTITGGTDADGAFVAASSTCTNIDCHSGTTTPGWYYAPDTAAPAWTPNSGIAATNPNQGGVLNVTWNAAVDAYPSNPVTYDLYMATTNTPAAVFAEPPLVSALTGTATTVTGLADGTTYYFGVRAKDNWATKNVSANTDISGGTAPGPAAPPAPTSTVYYLTKPASATNLWGAVTTNLNLTCGTATSALAVASAPLHPALPSPAAPPAGRGLLTTTKDCGAASVNNYMASDATPWAYAWRNFGGFYSAPYANKTVVSGSSTGNTFGFQGSTSGAPYDQVLVLFAVVDSSGNHTGDTGRYVSRYGLTNAMAAYSFDLSPLSVTVPAGSRLAVLIYYYDYYYGDVNHRIAYDNYSAAITNQVTLKETILDVFPPTWPGGVSGIAAQDAGTDGVLRVSWNTATDPGLATTPPVVYDIYRVQSAACTGLWDSLNLYRSNLGSTSFQDTGLTNGLTYCYGVLAKDSANPVNVTTGVQTAAATPSRGAAFGCNSCHASPPTSAGNAGSHAAHANNDADYTECNNCHPGTTSYTNSHQNGSGQLAFDGTAATAVYNGLQLSYTDNALVIYNDTNGYGILTGSTGDGIDNGTCAGTPATYCHGAASPTWGNAATALCSSCHNGGGGTLAPTVTMASSHVTAPGGTVSCKDCHAGHFRGVRIPLPPASWSNTNLSATNMRTQLGIGYTNAGGIDLGGPGTVASIATKTTEAEICWGCHDSVATPVSEWGYNTKTTPAGYPVATFATADGNLETENQGWLYLSSSYATKTSDWTQGFWMSAYDPLLKRRIASVHTASLDPAGQSSSVAANVWGNGTVNRTSPTLENKGAIRCSYCHDVHNTFGPNGKPYLRGSWVGDPYPPELPPRGTYAYTTAVSPWAATPRGLSTARDKGGYFIDQNSNWPTKNAAMDTTAETSGLCTLCHGANVDSMDYYTGSKLWLPGMSNGHSNSNLGGTGANKTDLFTGNRYGCGMGMQLCVGGQGGCEYPLNDCGHLGNPGRCGDIDSFGNRGDCAFIGTSGWCGTDCANWYGTGTIGGAEGPGTMAHNFTCSKCHSPHASGLPALMIQNCIDTGLSSFGIPGNSVSANNCHRKTSTTDGWHIMAPGQ